MIRVGMREVAGWILLALGVAAFIVCYAVFLLQRRVIEAAVLAFIGFTTFRGGVHLLKVSLAAKAAYEAAKPPARPGARGRA